MRTFILALLALTMPALAAASPAKASAPVAGVVTSVSGKAVVYAEGSTVAGEIKLAASLHAGDRIKTGANGRAVLMLTDGTRLNVGYNTDITLRDKDSAGKSSARGIASIKIVLGELWAKVTKKDSRLEFETPAGVAAVKGTEPGFVVTGGADATTCIYLLTGAMTLSNPTGTADMTALTQACLGKGTKLSQSLIHAWDGVTGKPTDLGGTASGADVSLQYQGSDGTVKTLGLRYSK